MDTSKIISKSSTIALDAGLDQVFPLFGPIREKDWAAGWDPTILVGDPNHVEERMVFQTPNDHPDDKGPATWIVSKFDADRSHIEYAVYTQTRLWWITIQCRANENGNATDATIEYAYFGLGEQAQRQNRQVLHTLFRHDLKDWQAAINHYLRTGTVLHQPHSHHHPHR